MALPRRLRVAVARYFVPTALERDAGYRTVLDEATWRGLRVAGVFGIASGVVFAITAIALQVLSGEGMVDAALRLREVLTDRLQVLAASTLFLVVARFRPSVRVGRILVMTYVVAAALVFLYDDVTQITFSLTAAWLALLLMFMMGTVPFQPWQTAAVGAFFTSLLALAIWTIEVDFFAPGGGMMRIVYLILAAIVTTATTSSVYAGRHDQYRTAQRLERLKERLRLRGFEMETRGRALERQRAELEASLGRLSKAQTQLVQQEKMASLGQLTAGVAHELKNPLNFVNNFAQLSAELLDDFEAELGEDPDRPVREALAASADLIGDLRANAQKIREHGRRADGIIRSMLAHSRATPGPRRPAPLNRLLDEYVGLAFHGMRAEHQGFNVDVRREYDADVGEIAMVPEEMGRVFLNLLDNAFAAVRERAEAGEEGYAPVVTIRSRSRPDGGAEIAVIDNGTGISAEDRERIFEPFFTTKPTGEGTGLGLSLTYEIVVHGHGGELLLTSEKGTGTTFTVVLPAALPDPDEPAAVEAERAAP